MERKNGQLPTGEYRVVIGKCSRFARQMIFLEPIKEEDSSFASEVESYSSSSEAFVSEASSSEVSSSETASSSSSLPLPETCKRCRMERKSHEFGCLEELYALPCPMMQPGNCRQHRRENRVPLLELCHDGTSSAGFNHQAADHLWLSTRKRQDSLGFYVYR